MDKRQQGTFKHRLKFDCYNWIYKTQIINSSYDWKIGIINILGKLKIGQKVVLRTLIKLYFEVCIVSFSYLVYWEPSKLFSSKPKRISRYINESFISSHISAGIVKKVFYTLHLRSSGGNKVMQKHQWQLHSTSELN